VQGQPPPQGNQGQAGNLPAWLGPIVSVTTQFGVPTVFAAVLLWFVLFKVDGAMRAIQEGEETRTKIIAAMQDTLVAALNKQTDRFEEAIQGNIAVNKELWARLERMMERQGSGGYQSRPPPGAQQP
jgi:hypothetical protein